MRGLTPLCMAWVLVTSAHASTPATRLDAAALAQATLGPWPGVAAVGVLRGQRMDVAILSRARWGVAPTPVVVRPEEEPVFELGSVSKVFTGLLVAQAIERGELRLDDRLGTLLATHVPFRWEQAQHITVRQLLSHTACLPRWPASLGPVPSAHTLAHYERTDLWHDLGELLLTRTPPCAYRYSNWGYALLGESLAQHTGNSWESLLQQAVTRRLGMASTAVALSPALAVRLAPAYNGTRRADRWPMKGMAGAGGLHATVTDMLRFSRALLAGQDGPLGAAGVRAVTPISHHGDASDAMAHGVMLPAQATSRAWVHQGLTAGYRATWVAWPDHTEAVVLLVSNRAAPTEDITRRLLREMPPEPDTPPVFTRGEFRGSSRQSDRLYAHIQIAPERKLPFSTLRFRVLDNALLVGLNAGSRVEFRTERVAGEMVLSAIRPAPP